MKRELISGDSPYEHLIGFSRAVRIGPYIVVGGTAPIDKEGKTIGVGDISSQTRQCFEIIKAALEKAGSSLDHVVRTRIMLTDISQWKKAAEVRAVYLKHIKPVDTIVEVAGFIDKDWLIEIEADAIISTSTSSGS